jgi:hypothetical protein
MTAEALARALRTWRAGYRFLSPVRRVLVAAEVIVNLAALALIFEIRGVVGPLDILALVAVTFGVGLTFGAGYVLLRGALDASDRALSDLRLQVQRNEDAVSFVLETTPSNRGRVETYQ